jgi:archaeal chaperonin
MSKNMQPIFILPESTQRTTGKNAQRNNILAAKLVAETVRTTLGPMGMDKMIVDSLGDIVVTNDGVTILEEMQAEHPAAKMIIEIAKTQEEEIGDGTTTAVVIAGELLKSAESLLDKNIHPTVIAKGYKFAEEKAIEILKNISKDINKDNDDLLRKVASTALVGKGAESAKDILSSLAVYAVKKVLDDSGEEIKFNKNDVKIEKKTGGIIEDSILIDGIVLEKEIVHSAMPKKFESAKILLLDCAIELKSTEIDAKIEITNPSQMQTFLQQEEDIIKSMVEKIAESGANVVFCQKGIDDLAQHFLTKKGIIALRRLKKSDLEALSRASGAKIVSRINDISEKDLGEAGRVEEKKINDEYMTFVTGCKNPKAVTILIRGGTDHIVDEAKRALSDAVGDVAIALKSGKVVAGAGAPEMEVARGLRKFADSLSGREQLAVLAFADSLEIIPRTLAENAGLDPIDVLTELNSAHEKNQIWAGVDVFSGKILDSWVNGIIEPLSIKIQAINSASEVARMILRIDDVITGGKANSPASNPGMNEMY